ncbi:MAG TPA: VOC family protein [Actinomycetota bacterium]|jgi:hypothetical protein
MASLIKAVTWDCGEPRRVAAFWAAALGTDVDEDSTDERAFVEAAGWGGPNMWFVKVSEGKTAKNRMHFDLRPPGRMDDEVERLRALGATEVHRFATHVYLWGLEGNEFCVELGPGDENDDRADDAVRS